MNCRKCQKIAWFRKTSPINGISDHYCVHCNINQSEDYVAEHGQRRKINFTPCGGSCNSYVEIKTDENCCKLYPQYTECDAGLSWGTKPDHPSCNRCQKRIPYPRPLCSLNSFNR